MKYLIIVFFIILIKCNPYDNYNGDFHMFDIDQDNKLTFEEVNNSFQDNEEFVKQLFEKYDRNGDKIIEFEEYKESRIQEERAFEEMIKELNDQLLEYEHDDF